MILSTLFFILIFLSGSVGFAMEDFSSEDREQDTVQSVRSFQAPDGIGENKDFSLSGADIETSSLCEDSGITEQRLLVLRDRLRAEENEEPLIGESDLRENISIPLVFNDVVEYYIRYFTTTKKNLFKRWLKRKKRYAPLVRGILREHGLPEDLVYLAMIESGFNLHAYSPMKAAGPWQFIPETGRRYGLVVNHWVDERRDIRKSTIAAARYLQKLFDQFGCWYLAAAGYNAGENRIDKVIKRYDTKDFWQLRAYNTLPRETREYVPQLIAAAVIAKDPERYGLGSIENVPPFEFVKVTVPGGVPLKAVAKAASIDLPSIRTLNPEIRRGITPPGKGYGIKLPADTDTVIFRSSLTSILNEGKRVVGVIRYLTQRQDNVWKITRRYRVSKKDLALVNDNPLRLKRGKTVYIPRFEVAEGPEGRINRLKTDSIIKGKRLSLASHVEKASKRSQKKYHRVKRGDTLSRIAEKYRKSVHTLKKMNRLKNNCIRSGMRLRVSSSRITPVLVTTDICSKT